MNPDYRKLAELLVRHSVRLRKSERVLINVSCVPSAFTVELVRAAYRRKAEVFVKNIDPRVSAAVIEGGTESQFKQLARHELAFMKSMDAYISIGGADNIFENSGISPRQMLLSSKALKPVLDYRVGRTKWVGLRWPNASMAQQAGMGTEAFERLFFKCCTLDYPEMKQAMRPLKALMDRTDKVHIRGPGTDLRFSIKGIPSILCAGEYNIPDGEVFTAPVRDSVEGKITFNAPTIYQGIGFDNVRLEFKKGRVVASNASNKKALDKILDTDKGSRFIGEFAIGVNPHITEPMRDILFDEKIAGSFHFTPGQAYAEASNGNRSQIHWDMVCIQRPAYGGGEMYFDGKLVRKNGLFILKNLEKLNPKRLIAGT